MFLFNYAISPVVSPPINVASVHEFYENIGITVNNMVVREKMIVS